MVEKDTLGCPFADFTYRRAMEHIAIDVAFDGHNAFVAMTIWIMNMR